MLSILLPVVGYISGQFLYEDIFLCTRYNVVNEHLYVSGPSPPQASLATGPSLVRVSVMEGEIALQKVGNHFQSSMHDWTIIKTTHFELRMT